MTIRASVDAVDDAVNDVCEANTCMLTAREFQIGQTLVLEWDADDHEMRQYHEECYGIPDVQLDELVTQLRARVTELSDLNSAWMTKCSNLELDNRELTRRNQVTWEHVFHVPAMTSAEYVRAVNAGKSFILNERAGQTPANIVVSTPEEIREEIQMRHDAEIAHMDPT